MLARNMLSAPKEKTVALMYHALGETEGPGIDPHYAVDTAVFVEHMALCIRRGGAVVNAKQWLAGQAGVIVTFDDGHLTNYLHGFPALAAIKGSADFFVNPAQVGTDGFASWAQLREMADGGMSIQSHGLDHRYYLTDLSPEKLRDDLRRARLEIEEHVGHPCTLLAPPGGRAPAGLERVAQEVGYTHVLTSKPGTIKRGSGTSLCRLAVTRPLSIATLDSWLTGGRELRRTQVRQAVLDAAKRVLGDRRYEAVRRRLLQKAS
ncbi:MAG: polysaccharide deacetylase family protein [Myxococcota bacterium]